MLRQLLMTQGLILTLAAGLVGQDSRYELGLRVRAFERAFEAVCDDPEARAEVCQLLEEAVTAFFGVRLAEVARNMDAARRALAGRAADPAERWADSLSLRPAARLLPHSTRELALHLLATYPVDVEPPPAATLRLLLVDAAGTALQAPFDRAIDALPLQATLPLTFAEPGDHRLRVEIRAADRVLAHHEQTISFVNDLAVRWERIEDYTKVAAKGTSMATGRGLARLLRSLLRGGTKETDIAAARHFDELESIAHRFGPAFGIDIPGDFRLWLDTGDGIVAARVMVPPQLAAKTNVPVVVALHGAGGSENLFFDGYGDGKIVALCRQRGWLLVAPRSGLGGGAAIGGVVRALRAMYPIDTDRVFAVGHSMGASQLMTAAARDPAGLRAIALLGGGGSTRAVDRLRDLPIFLAPGEKDFARPNARRLRDALRAAEVTGLVYREYAATEHLGIVQVALDSVFAFFDDGAK